jgi:hypothetical protein
MSLSFYVYDVWIYVHEYVCQFKPTLILFMGKTVGGLIYDGGRRRRRATEGRGRGDGGGGQGD